MSDLIEALNPVQREAVVTVDGPVLVLAGAGSGKTRVLTHKVAHLVQDHDVPVPHILAFTFTNKAAQEMRERIEGLLGAGAGRLWMGTFHGTCLRILRTFSEAAGLPRGFSVFDRDDSIRVLKKAIRDQHLSEQEFRPRGILEKISSAKSSMLRPGDVTASAATRLEGLWGDLYAAYEAELARQNALDFDDLLIRSLRLLMDSEDVREQLATRFRYVLVDEYQDTNKVQFELTRLLASTHRNLTVVGDDDQSIYGWRGADIRNILDFERHFPEARVFRLEQNYRSSGRILDAANAVVANNKGRKPKSLWTENGPGEKLMFTIAPDEEREAEDVVRRLIELRRQGEATYAGAVVLYRTNAQSRPFEEVCLRHRVSYRIVGGVHFFQRREIKDVLAYLRLAANPRDEVSFDRAIATPKRGVGDVSRERLIEHAGAEGLDLVQVSVRAAEVPGLSRAAAVELNRFGALIAGLQDRLTDLPADEAVELVIRESGIWESLIDGGAESVARRENLDELVASARYHALRGESPGIGGYLEEISLRTDIDGWDPGEDAVTLMTAHNAKGLEFDVVFVAGLEEGLFPHASSLESGEELEEERRLMYVALTRARRRCFLSASRDRRRMNRFEGSRLSRFLTEIPEELVERRDPWGLGLASGRFAGGKEVHRHGAAHRRAAAPAAMDFEEPAIDVNDDRRTPEYVGRVVWHAKYGRGVVLRQDGHGDGAKCEVRFMGQLTRKIVARFLDLEDEDGGG